MSATIDNLAGVERRIKQGGYLFHQGDAVISMFVIQSGEMHLIRRRSNGGTVILQRGRPGDFLAEASLFVDSYHCDAVAVVASTVKAISRAAIRLRFARDPEFAVAWANYLASEVREARLRTEMLSCKTVAERLDLWLAQNDALPEKGRWRQVAEEISSSPEALYREIARRRNRG